MEFAKTNANHEWLLSLIRERKSKKILCDKDTLKEEASKQLNMNVNSFKFSMETLLKQDRMTENHRSGKIHIL